MDEKEIKRDQLIEFRVGLLETQYSNILKLVQETHDAVTTIRAKMGDGPLNFHVHGEKLSQIEKRMDNIERSETHRNKEQDETKQFIYKTMGALSVVLLIMSLFVGPLFVRWIWGTGHEATESHQPIITATNGWH